LKGETEFETLSILENHVDLVGLETVSVEPAHVHGVGRIASSSVSVPVAEWSVLFGGGEQVHLPLNTIQVQLRIHQRHHLVLITQKAIDARLSSI